MDDMEAPLDPDDPSAPGVSEKVEKRNLAPCLSALLLLTVVSGYLYLNAADKTLLVFGHAFHLLAVFAFFLVWTAVGRRILRRFGLKTSGFLEGLVFSAGAGLGACIVIIFTLASIGLLDKQVIKALHSILLLLLFPEIRLMGEETLSRSRAERWGKWGLFEASLSILTGLFVVGAVIWALAPPTSLDSVLYHLFVARAYLENGGFLYLPSQACSAWPQNLSLLWTVGLAFHDGSTARLLNVGLSLLLLLSMAGFVGRRRGGVPGEAALACFIFYSSVFAIKLAGICYTEMGLSFFIFTAFFAWRRWLDSREEGEEKAGFLILAGFLLGLAAGGKLMGAFPTVALFLLTLYRVGLGERRPRQAVRRAVLLAGVSFLTVLPWYVKSYIYTGNPLFPFLIEVLGGRNFTAGIYDALMESERRRVVAKSFPNFLTAPFDISFLKPGEFGIFTYGPIFMGLLPTAWLIKKERWVRDGLWLMLLTWPFWFWTSPIDRYAGHLLPIAAVIGGRGGYAAAALSRAAFAALCAAVLLVSAVNSAALLNHAAVALPYITGKESRDEYLSSRIGAYPLIKFMNENLTPVRAGARLAPPKILMVAEPSLFHVEVDTVLGDPLAQGYVNYYAMSGPEDLLARLVPIGVTHIFINHKVTELLPRYDARIRGLIDGVTDGYCTRIGILYTSKGEPMASLYAIKPQFLAHPKFGRVDSDGE